MPADRSKPSRRVDTDVSNLIWTQPLDANSMTTGIISFAPPATPEHFEYGDSDVGDECFQHRASQVKKKEEERIPRPPNAFILFRSSFIKSRTVSSEVETNHSTLSKIIGMTWSGLSQSERDTWHEKAKVVLDAHKEKFPQYTFRPTVPHPGKRPNSGVKGAKGKGKGKGKEKRRVREVEPKDMKRCAKIAELLVKGKTGEELDAAISEFDKHHIREIETRFEVPITESAFRPQLQKRRRSTTKTPPPASSDNTDVESSDEVLGRSRRSPKTRKNVTRPQSDINVQDGATFQIADYTARAMSIPSNSAEASFSFESFSFDSMIPNMVMPVTSVEPEALNLNTEYYPAVDQTFDGLTHDFVDFSDCSPSSPIAEIPYPAWEQCMSPVDDTAPPTPVSPFSPEFMAGYQFGYTNAATNYIPEYQYPSNPAMQDNYYYTQSAMTSDFPRAPQATADIELSDFLSFSSHC